MRSTGITSHETTSDRRPAAQVAGSQQTGQSRSAAVGNFQFHPAAEGDLVITMEDLLAFTSSSTHETGPSPATGMLCFPIFPAPGRVGASLPPPLIGKGSPARLWAGPSVSWIYPSVEGPAGGR